MTRTALAAISIMAATGMLAQQETTAPLRPVESDSIYFMDFFWHGVQEKALKTVTTTPARPYVTETLSPSRIAEMERLWDTTLDSLDILGESPDCSLGRSLRLFRQSYALNLLTGQAKYMDLAEHVLTNSILPRWESEAPGADKDEATRLLRTVNKMAYSTSGSNIYANMLMRTNAHIKTGKLDLFLRSVNSSPWYNETTISVAGNNDPIEMPDVDSPNIYQKIIHHDSTSQHPPCEASLHLRIPMWATGETPLPNFNASVPRKANVQVMVNGTALGRPSAKDGYIVITRKWAVGDLVTVRIPTPIMRLASSGRPDSIALQRGPFVYYYVGAGPDDSISRSGTVSHQFSRTDNAVVLSGVLYGSENRFYALPYYREGEKGKLFMPAK